MELVVDQHGAKRFIIYSDICLSENTGEKVCFNKMVLLGAVLNFVMALTFVMATKMTTAANAIVLQFTEPVF